jgi:hypothetical protein
MATSAGRGSLLSRLPSARGKESALAIALSAAGVLDLSSKNPSPPKLPPKTQQSPPKTQQQKTPFGRVDDIFDDLERSEMTTSAPGSSKSRPGPSPALSSVTFDELEDEV